MTQTTRRPFRLAVAAVALAAVSAIAIVGIGAHSALAQGGHGMGHHAGKSHDEHFAQMATALGLSDQQKAAAKRLHEAAAAKAGPIMEQAKLQHEEIEAMLESGSADPTEVGRRVIALFATHKQLEAIHEQTVAKISAQLTAQQRARFDKLRSEHGPGHHGPWWGGFDSQP